MLYKLHWLDVHWVMFSWWSLCTNVWVVVHLSIWAIIVSQPWSHRYLQSAEWNLLHILRHRLSTCGRWTFAIVDSSVWNSLLNHLCNLNATKVVFRQLLKTCMFARYYCIWEGFYGWWFLYRALYKMMVYGWWFLYRALYNKNSKWHLFLLSVNTSVTSFVEHGRCCLYFEAAVILIG